MLIGCDLVVAASEEALAKLNDKIAHAVINTHEAATAEFTRNPDAQIPGAAMREALIEAVGEGKSHFVDATRLATRLLGDSIASNLFMLGFAYQKGLLPVSADAIDKAIEINGVAVQLNQQAFLWGRRAAHDLAAVEKLVQPTPVKAPCVTLDELISDRVARLSAYQNARYAERYRALVQRVSRADTSADQALSKAVARYYFKLLAYKDEYEVARLYSDGSFIQQLEAQFAGDYRLQFHLAPSWLSQTDASGQPRKRQFGPWMLKAFAVLAHFKFLRGTLFDPFGHSAERKVEQALIGEYEALIELLLSQLRPDNYRTALTLAELPEQIRGYGHVKEQSVVKARAQAEQLKAHMQASKIPAVQLCEPAA